MSLELSRYISSLYHKIVVPPKELANSILCTMGPWYPHKHHCDAAGCYWNLILLEHDTTGTWYYWNMCIVYYTMILDETHHMRAEGGRRARGRDPGNKKVKQLLTFWYYNAYSYITEVAFNKVLLLLSWRSWPHEIPHDQCWNISTV